MRRKSGFIALAVMFSVFLISGCGGGGGGSSSPAAPSAPTGVTATAGDNSVSIAWTAVAGATSYNIYYATTDNVTKATGTKIAGVTSPNIVTGLTNSTPYFFVVTALNAVGESADSSQVSATPTLALPVAPTGVTATAGHGEATIGWDNVAGATSYNIYYSTTAGVTKANGDKLANRTSPSIVTGLTNGTPYYFVVTAVNATGEGPVSSEVSATPTAAPAPAAPTGVSATPGHGEATISWTAVTGATSYNLYYSSTAGVTKATGTKITNVISPRIVTPLTNGTTWYFVVTAVNANGESVDSSQVSALPTTIPATSAPAGVTATPGPGNATIGWDNVTGATSYNVYYSTTTGVTKATGTKVALATSPKVINGLIRGTPVYFVVTAVNSDGIESADSSQVSTTPDPPNPTYSQADLTGVWNVRVILSGTSPGWYGGAATVDSSGNITNFTNSSPTGPTTPPAVSGLSITSGTDNTAGVVTEKGTDNNVTFFGKMSTSKNLIIGTSTMADGTTFALHVFVKRVPGVTFSSTDLANTLIAYQKIYSGDSHIWERGNGSINGAGQMTLSSVEDSNGPVSSPAATGISVNSTTGIVSIATEPSFSGVMTPDKKIIVGTSTDASGIYSLRIIQMRGQTYTQADLSGVHHAFGIHSDSTSSWARGIWSTDVVGNVTILSLLDSDGPVTPPGPFTQIIDEQGNVPARGMLSFGKDLFVDIGDFSDGAYLDLKVQ